jgi:hypothetical protein
MSVFPKIKEDIKLKESAFLEPDLVIKEDATQRKIPASEIYLHEEMNDIDRDKMLSVMDFLNCLDKLSKSV